jgi:hypothetical protein
MRVAIIGLLALAGATLVASPQPASAQFSFFNKRFCAQGYGFGRTPDCSYNTWEQCRAAASGNGAYCTENPNYRARDEDRRSKRRH